MTALSIFLLSAIDAAAQPLMGLKGCFLRPRPVFVVSRVKT